MKISREIYRRAVTQPRKQKDDGEEKIRGRYNVYENFIQKLPSPAS